MKINELFDSPVNWQWIDHGQKHHVAEFTVDNIKFQVVFILIPIYDKQDNKLKFMNVWDVEFKDPNDQDPYGVTGKLKSRSNLVFATVLDIIKKFKQQNPDATLKFTAQEPNRQKLYSRFVRILAKTFKTKSAQSPDGKMGYLVR